MKVSLLSLQADHGIRKMQGATEEQINKAGWDSIKTTLLFSLISNALEVVTWRVTLYAFHNLISRWKRSKRTYWKASHKELAWTASHVPNLASDRMGFCAPAYLMKLQVAAMPLYMCSYCWWRGREVEERAIKLQEQGLYETIVTDTMSMCIKSK